MTCVAIFQIISELWRRSILIQNNTFGIKSDQTWVAIWSAECLVCSQHRHQKQPFLNPDARASYHNTKDLTYCIQIYCYYRQTSVASLKIYRIKKSSQTGTLQCIKTSRFLSHCLNIDSALLWQITWKTLIKTLHWPKKKSVKIWIRLLWQRQPMEPMLMEATSVTTTPT